MLQVVDISIVRGELVPVGEDQVAHLELSREIVRRFNRLYGDVLVEPQPLLSDSPLIPGSDGRKMSKSLDNTIGRPRGPRRRSGQRVRSFITDPQKLRRGDPGRPEICPVFALHRKFSPDDVDRIEATCRTGELGCVDCKTILADHLVERFAPFRERRADAGSARRVSSGEVLAAGADAVRPIARSTLRRSATRCIRDEPVDEPTAQPAPTAASRSRFRASTGPFRLLADLILEQKVDVCDVPIATVTERFLRYAKEARSWNLEEATWFLAICAVLLELKVSRLTPKQTELDEEDLLGGSPDLAYARSHRAARVPEGGARARAASRGRGRVLRRATSARGRSSRTCTPTRWRRSPGRISRPLAAQLLRPPPAVDLSHVTPIRFTVTDAMTAVEAHLHPVRRGRRRSASWSPTARTGSTSWCGSWRSLELYRDGKVELQQAPTFGEIEVEWKR